jgi:hypothetical protein
VWYSSKKFSKQRPAPHIGQQYAEVFFFPCFEHITYFLCCFVYSVLGATFSEKILAISHGTVLWDTCRPGSLPSRSIIPLHSPANVSSRFTPLPTCLPSSLPSAASREYFANKHPVTIFCSRTRVRFHRSYDRETVSNH